MVSVLCHFLGHHYRRDRVWFDGLDFRTSCTRCGTPLIRDFEDRWRPFNSERDASLARTAHPASQPEARPRPRL